MPRDVLRPDLHQSAGIPRRCSKRAQSLALSFASPQLWTSILNSLIQSEKIVDKRPLTAVLHVDGFEVLLRTLLAVIRNYFVRYTGACCQNCDCFMVTLGRFNPFGGLMPAHQTAIPSVCATCSTVQGCRMRSSKSSLDVTTTSSASSSWSWRRRRI